MSMPEKQALREVHRFRRTVCSCALCAAPCRHIPGSLDPSDLARLCPAGQDLLTWAEQHLRALTDRPVPTLVPARQADGACHWHFDGRCAVHDNAPYSCAFFDSHMSGEEERRRTAATLRARLEDAAAGGLYYRVWQHLCQRGLTARVGDRAALLQEARQVLSKVDRPLRQPPCG
jgi:hypothetical protein